MSANIPRDRFKRRVTEADTASCSQPEQKRKTFVVGNDDDRPLLFTPTKYNSATGLLYGVNQSERPMVLPLARLLMPYEEHGLDWSDESDSDTPDL
jgi:hypothetical protein